jgi:GT2 family glycosyltransferase
MIRVTAIMVSHDGAGWLAQSVAALASQSLAVDRVVAVDTGSTDDSVRMLRSAGIHVIESERTLGFGDAIKLALDATPPFTGTRSAKRSKNSVDSDPAIEEEWLWILHDDCAPAKDALARLVAAVTDRPQVAVAGPKLRGWHDRKHLLEVGVSIATNGARWTGLEYREQDQGQHDDERDVLAVSTAAMLVRRDVFEELGGFDPHLSLFRDDVDFGWRVRTAGYSVIAVPEAVAFHGEAAANERRSIDVHEAYLHRPLLLDRRNAAYVLLANASLLYLPLLGLQLLIGSLARALGYFVVKLPGYALDELGAVALVLIKPQEIFAARRARRRKKLLSASSVKSYLPPRGVQLRLLFERARDAVSEYFQARTSFHLMPQSESRSVLDLNDESLADEDLLIPNERSTLRQLMTRPSSLFAMAVLLITLIASRNRIGDLAGGALLPAPDGGMDLIAKYLESWHPIALGSSANSPTWILITGLSSALFLGNLQLFITVFFLLALPITVLIGYRFAKRHTSSNLIALLAALVYGFSPPVLFALTHGAIGTLVVAIIAPIVIRSLQQAFEVERLTIRSLAGYALVYGLLLSFSPPAFIIVAAWHFLASAIQSIAAYRQGEWSLMLDRIYRRSAILLGAIAVNVPWSLELLIHPSRALLEPGLALESESALILLANPGQSWWLLSAAPVLTMIALFRSANRFTALLALFTLVVAAILSLFDIAGHGSSRLTTPSLGGSLMLFVAISLIAGLALVEEVLPRIRDTALNLRHIATLVMALSVAVSLLASIIWWVGPGANGPLRAEKELSVPEFITANATTEERFKSLILRQREGRLFYYVVRDRELELGDSDLIYGSSRRIDEAVSGLVTGVGIDTSIILGQNGIRYLFLASPYNKGLARTIDGIGGFTRASSTDVGIVWKVVAANARLSLTPFDQSPDASAVDVAIASGEVSAEGTISRAGVVTLAERFDGRWKMLVNSRPVQLSENIEGLPQFDVVEPGEFLLFHDGTARRGWLSLQVIALLLALILATPARRRRAEVPIEELS